MVNGRRTTKLRRTPESIEADKKRQAEQDKLKGEVEKEADITRLKERQVQPREQPKFQLGQRELTKEEFATARVQAGFPTRTGSTPIGERRLTPRVTEAVREFRERGEELRLTRAQEEQERQADAVTRVSEQRGLPEKFEKAGVFEQPELVPIISKEQEGLSVLGDMVIGIIPDILGLKELANLFGTKGQVERRRIADERVSETELELARLTIDKRLQSEISNTYDERIEQQFTTMGIGLSVFGAVVLSQFTGSFAQFIGTDKKVKNLGTGVTGLETIATDISGSVTQGDMSVDDGLDKLEQMDALLTNLEATLQRAGIESANVRISAKGRDLEVKILKARTKINTSKRKIAGFEVAGIIQPSPTTQKAVVLRNLQITAEREKQAEIEQRAEVIPTTPNF